MTDQTDEEIVIEVIKHINANPIMYNNINKIFKALDDILAKHRISVTEEKRIELGYIIYNTITGATRQ